MLLWIYEPTCFQKIIFEFITDLQWLYYGLDLDFVVQMGFWYKITISSND
jgi:hypothetical protein